MEENFSACFTGLKVFTKSGFVKKNVHVSNGKIVKITEALPDSNDVKVIPAPDCCMVPSFVDMHVHLREPGFGYKETIKTGTLAAAAGGFSTVCTMPNLKPSPDSLDNLRIQLDIIEKDACIHVLPFATITKSRRGLELVDYEALAPFVAGFSDDGSGVQSEKVMREAMIGIAKTGKILSAHCEVESLLNGGYIHAGEYARKHNHRGISSESEWKEVERDIRLAEETGCRLHIDHISTKETVELVRQAKQKGLPVTCETGPHYLVFNDADLKDEGRFKMNPPIRSKEDQEALLQGVADGTIDVIATDHAPHSATEKSRGLEKSAMGVVGLETAFSTMFTYLVDTSDPVISFERLIELMVVNPRKILGLSPANFIEEGIDADLVIFNPDETFIVNPMEFKSMGKATPFEGLSLKGKIKLTLFKGKPVYNSL